MSVRTHKFQIVKPLNMEWAVFGKILRDVQKEIRTASNRSTVLMWEWDNYNTAYKDKNGVYPVFEDATTSRSLDGLIYREVSKECILSNTGNLSQTCIVTAKRYKKMKPDIHVGDKSVPSYRKTLPIDVSKKSLRFRMEGNSFICNISLLSNYGVKQYEDLESGRVDVLLDVADRYNLVKSIVSGEYVFGASKLVFKEKGVKWYLHVPVTVPDVDEQADVVATNTMGVDLGVNILAAIAFNFSRESFYIYGDEVKKFRERSEARMRSLQRQASYCGEGRIGHGRKKRMRSTTVLHGKIANFRDAANHRYADYIIKMAVKKRCSVVKIEDLSGIGATKNKWLKDWTYYDLQQKIIAKALKRGIKVAYVDPAYTSQTCSECGNVDKSSRITQAEYVCTACGFTANADYNAARNISSKPEKVKVKKGKKNKGASADEGFDYSVCGEDVEDSVTA